MWRSSLNFAEFADSAELRRSSRSVADESEAVTADFGNFWRTTEPGGDSRISAEYSGLREVESAFPIPRGGVWRSLADESEADFFESASRIWRTPQNPFPLWSSAESAAVHRGLSRSPRSPFWESACGLVRGLRRNPRQSLAESASELGGVRGVRRGHTNPMGVCQ